MHDTKDKCMYYILEGQSVAWSEWQTQSCHEVDSIGAHKMQCKCEYNFLHVAPPTKVGR